jgi:hypothetical protein
MLDTDMPRKTDAEIEAEKIAGKIEGMIKRNADNLIYSISTEVRKRKCISPSTIGSRVMFVTVKLHNVNDPKEILCPEDWVRLGELGVEFDAYSGIPPTSIEFYKIIEQDF